MQFIGRFAVSHFTGFMLVAVVLGCGSHQKSASPGQPLGVDVVATNAEQLLDGRRLAFSFGSDIRDIWVLDHGRLMEVSKKARVTTGGSGCYGGPYGPGSGPCYEIAEPFSLSPDGKHLAFFLQDTTITADTTPPALIVSRSDGSHAHEVAASLGICVLCSFSTPSWDRNSRSFVIATQPWTGATAVSLIFRIAIRSGKVTTLAPPDSNYDELQPVVSPDGRGIAFLRSAAQGPHPLGGNTPVAFVYVMRASGGARTRLPLPPRPYTDLWWCGNSTTLCVDSPTKRLAASANVYRIDLRTGRVTHLRHWAEARYGGLSADGTLAIDERKTARGAEVFVGSVSAAGVAKFAPILAATNAKGNPFFEFSVSGP